jgi:hypothetical protein
MIFDFIDWVEPAPANGAIRFVDRANPVASRAGAAARAQALKSQAVERDGSAEWTRVVMEGDPTAILESLIFPRG